MAEKVEENCPLDGFNECRQLECAWFVKMRGNDPETGQETEEYACGMSWMPLLLIENVAHSANMNASVERFKEDMIQANNSSLELLQHKQKADQDQLGVIEQ